MAKENPKPGKKKSHKKTITGTLDIARSGMGFVMVDGEDTDIRIKPQHIGRAFHGDKVRVEIDAHTSKGARPEGIIKEVVERKNAQFVGHMDIRATTSFFVPSTDRGIPDFYIPAESLNGAVNGDRVLVALENWDAGNKKPVGRVLNVITGAGEIDLAMKEILLEKKFPISFKPEVLDAAERLSPAITQKELSKRRDFRNILTFTIDPFDAKDFDDAISIEKLKNGNYEIGVHIADVSHFVQEGSELDQSAYERATSVYLPDRVNPMLPEKISNFLCSLRPNEEKYSFSCVFEMSPEGKIKDTWIGRTVIESDKRFTYEDVQATLETGEGYLSEELHLLDKIAKYHRAKRFKNGAINFSSQEVRFLINENSEPVGVVIKESKDAHQLVEEFMLLANKTVAEFVSKIRIKKTKIPFPYRIHDAPNEEKLAPFAAFARKFGYKFDITDPEQVASSFNKLLKDVEGRPEQHVLEQLGIRTMAKAAYSPDNVGHYGLGFINYCHFTSPIRRYPDVMVHRIVQECLDNAPAIDKKMEEKSKHCSERERAAMECERSSNKYMQVYYMKQFLGDEFDAVVSGVAAFGFWAETVNTKCEGLVSVKDMVDFDVFRYEETDYQLIGMRTGIRIRLGDKVRVKLVAANLEKKQLDYDWIPPAVKPSGNSKPKAR